MPRYSAERKAALLKELLPPVDLSVAELARQEGISEVTLYAWRKQAKAEGAPVAGDKKLPDGWAAEAKFDVVLETAALTTWNTRTCRPARSCRRGTLVGRGVDVLPRSACSRSAAPARSQSPPRTVKAPTGHVATAASQVWSWDITYLPAAVRGQYFYLYLIEDICSRQAVGWEVYEQESGELGTKLLQRACSANSVCSSSRYCIGTTAHS